MRPKLLLATRNEHKKIEIKEILKELELDIMNLEDIPAMPEVDEDGETFAANALKKARTIAELSGYVTMADDSGLVVDALQGKPGVYSARFAGEKATDEENNRKLLKLMEHIPETQRTAHFECVIALVEPRGLEQTVSGQCPGRIAFAPRGPGGFGYDPLFIPDGYQFSFAELSSEEKNRISHRGQALAKARLIMPQFFKNV